MRAPFHAIAALALLTLPAAADSVGSSVPPAPALLLKELPDTPIDGEVRWSASDHPIEADVTLSGHPYAVVRFWGPETEQISVRLDRQQDASDGQIDAVAGILAKKDEFTQGAPVVGWWRRGGDGYFVMKPTTQAAAQAANATLLKSASWIDVAIVFASKRKGIISFAVPPDVAARLSETVSQ